MDLWDILDVYLIITGVCFIGAVIWSLINFVKRLRNGEFNDAKHMFHIFRSEVIFNSFMVSFLWPGIILYALCNWVVDIVYMFANRLLDRYRKAT